MSEETAGSWAVKGENLPWVLIPLFLIAGLAGALRASTLLFPAAQKTESSLPVAEPVAPVEKTVAAVTAEPQECAPVFSVHFRYAQAAGDVDPGQYRRLVQWLNDHPRTRLLIQGYADSTGNEFANMALSHQRAEFVKNTLLAAGLKNTNISLQAYGEYAPLSGSGLNSADQRRVTLEVPGFSNCSKKDIP